MRGGWPGWSSPTHVLGACETLQCGGAELRGKVRAFENCCGGSGLHALFAIWRHTAYFRDGVVRVNLHADKLLAEAKIRGAQP